MEDNFLDIKILLTWWISLFIFICLNHIFDVTYYDVRISLLFWILYNKLMKMKVTNNIK